MLPPFDALGNLPAGVHLAEWTEVNDRYGSTPHRLRLLGGLLRALQNLREAGCALAYLDGSFVSSTPHPNDFDACWETAGVDLGKVDPVLKTFAHGRALQKAKYFGELFPARVRADLNGSVFLDFFQIDKSTGNAKGIVAMHLQRLPR
jgi:hypothetical protein